MTPPTDEESKPASSTSSTRTITAIPLEAPVSLPLRPTLRERYNHLVTRLLPQPYYLHPLLTRSRLAIALLSFIFLLLLLIIILPILLTHRSSANVTLPTGAETYSGDGTYYGTGLGACGIASKDSQMVVAIAWELFDHLGKGSAGEFNPNLNPVCGRNIRARRAGRTKAVEVTVVDRCTGCEPEDLDFSPTAFNGIAEEWEGRVRIEWAWV
ncbi:RlpA-like double-psi beta-barrel-protein domain-containing protein-containing protein [Tricharina praecox]|uniref:RlpA-like double-psi beta-barrel-protein domain-containing protein-containing protein n=1 Tax=Tricharina praecox TaxID=43433 RepID=UPI00221E9946|nr:RlpA-like double-psi beta-barrel-protein domain-containing protein-containing protein [Tricharina praecox]KAI5856864.1 RlpA-like double-psi beta-barrel-protein domain-containing protein-containing protein [Tricharina praecox]